MYIENEIILFEYFTALPSTDIDLNSKIFKEAQKLSVTILKSFIKNNYLSKIHIISNSISKTVKNNKIKYHFVENNQSLNSILKNLTGKSLILIAPETNKINIKIAQKLKKKFTLLNSDFETLKIFASKKKTFLELRKKRIPVVRVENNANLKDVKYILKPIFGAGSENIKITNSDTKKKEGIIVQKYYDGEVGSFIMLCKKKRMLLLSCNKHILNIKKKTISQTGTIVGGLEQHRKMINNLAIKLKRGFPGLFGYIGVDILMIKGQWKILEVNTRFTSSFAGLEKAYGYNALKKITNLYLNEKIDKKIDKLLKQKRIKFN
mgnify:CR=1 FL=1